MTNVVCWRMILQAIVAGAAEYSKKSIDNRLTFVEKLLGAKSFDSVIQIQFKYAKVSYASFVAQATKMRELYFNLAKVAFKPIDDAITPKARSYRILRSMRWVCDRCDVDCEDLAPCLSQGAHPYRLFSLTIRVLLRILSAHR